MRALYKKELRAFLSSVIGTVVLAVFLLVSCCFGRHVVGATKCSSDAELAASAAAGKLKGE